MSSSSIVGSLVKSAADVGTAYASSVFGRNASEGIMNHQRNISVGLDTWATKKLYPMQLQSQLDNYNLEQAINSARTRDNVKNLMQGYREAGINPLLAVGDVGSGASQPILGMPGHSGVSSGGVSANSLTRFDPVGDYYTRKMQDADIDAGQASARESKALADVAEAERDVAVLKLKAEKQVLEGSQSAYPYGDDVDVLSYRGYQQLKDNMQKRLELDGYTHDKARAITLDVLHEVENGAGAVTGVVGSAAALKRVGVEKDKLKFLIDKERQRAAERALRRKKGH